MGFLFFSESISCLSSLCNSFLQSAEMLASTSKRSSTVSVISADKCRCQMYVTVHGVSGILRRKRASSGSVSNLTFRRSGRIGRSWGSMKGGWPRREGVRGRERQRVTEIGSGGVRQLETVRWLQTIDGVMTKIYDWDRWRKIRTYNKWQRRLVTETVSDRDS